MKDKKKPLAVDMLTYLEKCTHKYGNGTKGVNEAEDAKEYELDLKYITTFALIGIFEKLDEISKGIRSVSRS